MLKDKMLLLCVDIITNLIFMVFISEAYSLLDHATSISFHLIEVWCLGCEWRGI